MFGVESVEKVQQMFVFLLGFWKVLVTKKY
jgi:hypothetical protein